MSSHNQRIRYSLIQFFLDFLRVDPFWLRKITTDPHMFAHINVKCPYDRYPKLKIYISELILGSYEYIPAGPSGRAV